MLVACSDVLLRCGWVDIALFAGTADVLCVSWFLDFLVACLVDVHYITYVIVHPWPSTAAM